MAHLNQNRSKLLLGCGSAALAMSLAFPAEYASAQAIQATETNVVGSITRTFTGTGTETITVNTDVAVVDWTPDEISGVALDFLPNGNEVTFQNSSAIADFAVLNRILPSTNGDIVVFDGTLISRLIDPQTGAPLGPGGTVAFYSPTGIFVGSNAVFDVGNLVLTTLDPDLASFSDFALNGGQLQMAGSPTTAQIIINPGAQVTATAENSFFAITAAEIQMFGTSNVNGSTAFVAGETVNLTISNGLFDIEIPFGTTVGTPIVVDGNVGGPSSLGVGDNHLIYAVAAGQVDPISLLFSGNLGFAPAASAGVVNGEIILSANYEVSGRSVDGGSVDGPVTQLFAGGSELSSAPGSIFLNDFDSASSILAIANEEVQVTAFQGPSSIDGNLYMVGRNFAELTASNNQSFDITGDVLVSARDFGDVGPLDVDSQADAQAGSAFIDAFDGGTMTINGNVVVGADAFGGFNVNTGRAGAATGGQAAIASNGGSLTINGNASIGSRAFGFVSSGITSAGDSTGGLTQFFATQVGEVIINGDIEMESSATGSDGEINTASLGGNAFGGQAFTQVNSGGSLTVTGEFSAATNAFAGLSNISQTGALADAGEVNIFIDATETIDLQGDVFLVATGIGGINQGGPGGDGLGGAARGFVPNGGTLSIGGDFTAVATGVGAAGIGGGSGFGGIAGIQVLSGSVGIAGAASVDTAGFGANSAFGFGGNGGTGEGGNSFLQADGSAQGIGIFTVDGDVSLASDGFGGAGGDGDGDSTLAGQGGDGIGGSNLENQADPDFGSGAFLLSDRDNATYTIGGSTSVSAQGTGGAGGNGGTGQDGGSGGDGFGGFVQVGQATLSGTATLGDSISTAIFGDVTVFTNGVGGNGGIGSGTGTIRGNGGEGAGGASFFTTREGEVIAGAVSLNSDGAGGEGHLGGTGSGGTSSAQGGADGSMTFDSLQAFAIGRGGAGDNGGGAAAGGVTRLGSDSDDLAIDILNGAFLDSGALGGDALQGAGGDANGGASFLTITNATANLTGPTIIRAVSSGGSGTVGGNATGQQVSIDIIGGALNILPDAEGDAFIAIDSSAFGGSGVSQGGSATGASVNILVSEGVIAGGSISADSSGQGGDSDDIGGDGTGGTVSFVTSAADMALTGGLSVSAQGFGGGGTTGGDGVGGFANLDLQQTNLDVTPDANGLNSIEIDSSGFGGSGTSQFGDGIGGLAQLLMFEANAAAGTLSLFATGDAQSDTTGLDGGSALGGDAEAIIERNSTLSLDSFQFSSSALTSAGGVAEAGTSSLFIGNGGAVDVSVGSLEMLATAEGGAQNTAGRFFIDVETGQLFADTILASAEGDVANSELLESSLVAEGGNLLVSEVLSVSVTDDFIVRTGQGSIIGGPTVSAPTAAIDITSQGAISIFGDNDNAITFGGASLDLTSRDIEISLGARIGAITMNFTSLNDEDPAILGGSNGPVNTNDDEGYELSQEELARLEVGSFTFVQPLLVEAAPNSPTIVLRDATAIGSLDDGASNIQIQVAGSGGLIRVDGVVVFQDAAPTDALELFAPAGRIEVVTPGGIGVVDSNGNPTGSLFLGANQIWVADSDLISLLQEDPFFSGRNDQLSIAAAGSEDPLGFIRAGEVSLEVGSSLLVRNTGTNTAQGGILVGDGGLSIFAPENSESVLDVFAYGARIDENGDLVTGEAFYSEVNFNNASSGFTFYSDESEFNDCLINTNECEAGVTPPPTEEEIVDPVVVTINNPAVIEAPVTAILPIETSEQESNDEFGIDFPGLIGSEGIEEDGEIEDPVASGGDSSLYGQGKDGSVEVEGN